MDPLHIDANNNPGIEKIVKNVLHVEALIFNSMDICQDSSGQTLINLFLSVPPEADNICPFCGRKCPGYDAPKRDNQDWLKSWRSLDWGNDMVVLKAQTHRILCPEHGVVVAAIPWAYHNSCFTREFDKQVTWKAQNMSKSAVSREMRMSWPTVGKSITRVRNAEEPDISGRYEGLQKIGIDEVSYQTGHSYLTIIVNHDNNEVIDVAVGHSQEVLDSMLDKIPENIRDGITHVTADGAKWIRASVDKYFPNATFCIDSFHVVEWINEALSEIRLSEWKKAIAEVQNLKNERKEMKKELKEAQKNNDTEDVQHLKSGIHDLNQEIKKKEKEAVKIKGSLYALGKNPDNLTESQLVRLKWLMVSNKTLHRAYDRKEQIRMILKIKDPKQAAIELNKWIRWTSVSRLEPFKELGKKIKRHFDDIINTITYGLSNALIESTNNTIRQIINRAYGFRNVENLMNMVLLSCTSRFKNLPNRGNTSYGVSNWRSQTLIKPAVA